jgi:hypothetical protein
MSLGLLWRRFLAFEVHSQARGELGRADFERWERLTEKGSRASSMKMAAGARFLREWSGVTHVVERVEAGYRWIWEVLSLAIRHRKADHRSALVWATLLWADRRRKRSSAPDATGEAGEKDERGINARAPVKSSRTPTARCAIYPRASLVCQSSRRPPENGIILSQKVNHFSGGTPELCSIHNMLHDVSLLPRRHAWRLNLGVSANLACSSTGRMCRWLGEISR